MPSGDITRELNDVATSLEYAALAFKKGNFADAEPAYRRALEVLERLYGAGDPDTITCIQGLGDIYYATGRYKEAMPLYKRLLTIGEKVLGPEHPDVVDMVMRLGTTYEQLGMEKEAKSMYRRASKLSQTALSQLKPPQPFQPTAEVISQSATKDQSWRVLDPRRLTGNFLDNTLDPQALDLTDPEDGSPHSRGIKRNKFTKTRPTDNEKQRKKASKESLISKLGMQLDMLVYGVAGIILLVVVGGVCFNLAPRKANGVLSPQLAKFNNLTFKTADDYTSITMTGTMAHYSLGKSPQIARLEAVGPDIKDFFWPMVSSLTERQIWLEDQTNILKTDDGICLYPWSGEIPKFPSDRKERQRTKGSGKKKAPPADHQSQPLRPVPAQAGPEQRVISTLYMVGKIAEAWYQTRQEYPSQPMDLGLQYSNPVNFQTEIPDVQKLDTGDTSAGSVLEVDSGENLASALSKLQTARWHGEPPAEPGAIHCLCLIQSVSEQTVYRHFYAHGFDRNGKLITGHTSGSCFLIAYENGENLAPAVVAPKSVGGRPLTILIANLKGTGLILLFCHYMLPLFLTSLALGIFIIGLMFKPDPKKTMSDTGSWASKIAFLLALLAVMTAIIIRVT